MMTLRFHISFQQLKLIYWNILNLKFDSAKAIWIEIKCHFQLSQLLKLESMNKVKKIWFVNLSNGIWRQKNSCQTGKVGEFLESNYMFISIILILIFAFLRLNFYYNFSKIKFLCIHFTRREKIIIINEWKEKVFYNFYCLLFKCSKLALKIYFLLLFFFYKKTQCLFVCLVAHKENKNNLEHMMKIQRKKILLSNVSSWWKEKYIGVWESLNSRTYLRVCLCIASFQVLWICLLICFFFLLLFHQNMKFDHGLF